MDLEMEALEMNSTRTLATLPPEKKHVRCKWVYIVKYKVDGTIGRYKVAWWPKGSLKLMEWITWRPLHRLQK